MEELPLSKPFKDYRLDQLEATEDGYIYVKRYSERIANILKIDPEFIISYEVFAKVVQKEMDIVLGGNKIHYEQKVAYPSNTSFGAWAFDTRSLEKAREILASFKHMEVEAEVEIEEETDEIIEE